MNHFELFELPISIKVDAGYLNKKYIELQKKYHPDYFTLLSEEEQLEALEKSAQINKAIKVLKSEDATIKYLLQLKGLLLEEEKYDLNADFLMEMMELNESLMEGDKDAAVQKINQIQDEIYKTIQTLINQYNDANVTTADLLQLKEYYYKKKYLQRLLEKI